MWSLIGYKADEPGIEFHLRTPLRRRKSQKRAPKENQNAAGSL
jgi:hypothetical protein